MLYKKTFVVASAFLAAALTVAADDKKPFDDATFVKMAASGGMFEVELGKVAAMKAKTDGVKKFGQQMVQDHSKANEELKTVAKAAGIEVPAKINAKHAKHFDMLANHTGEDFDRAYVKHMVKDHEEDIALFTRASKEAKNQEIKDFATKTLPTLQKHLEMVKKLDQ